MPITILYKTPSMTAEQYDEAIQRLEEAGVLPNPALLFHTCFGADDNLQVVDLWESVETFEAFAERLAPILAEVGIFSDDPEIHPTHDIIPSTAAWSV